MPRNAGTLYRLIQPRTESRSDRFRWGSGLGFPVRNGKSLGILPLTAGFPRRSRTWEILPFAHPAQPQHPPTPHHQPTATLRRLLFGLAFGEAVLSLGKLGIPHPEIADRSLLFSRNGFPQVQAGKTVPPSPTRHSRPSARICLPARDSRSGRDPT